MLRCADQRIAKNRETAEIRCARRSSMSYRLFRAMAENRPPNRPGYNRARPSDQFPNDRERVNRARQAAEALFAPKPRADDAPVLPARPATERRLPVAPRASPPPDVPNEPAIPRERGAAIATTRNRNQNSADRNIPAAHIARIRTWLRYGMKISEVAKVYGVEIEDIERVLGKP